MTELTNTDLSKSFPPLTVVPIERRRRIRRWLVILLLCALVSTALLYANIYVMTNESGLAAIVERAGGQYQSWDPNPYLARLVNQTHGVSTRSHIIRFVEAHVSDDWLRDHKSKIAGLSNLRLTLRKLSLTSDGIEQLREMKKVIWLELEGTKLADSDLDVLSTLKGLVFLNVAHTGVSLTPLKSWVGTKLFGVGVDASHLTEEGIAALQGLTSLRLLYIYDATDETLDLISQLPTVNQLRLQGSTLTYSRVQKLMEEQSLQRLTLVDTNLTKEEMAILSKGRPQWSVYQTTSDEDERIERQSTQMSSNQMW